MEVMRNGRNHFAREERQQPLCRALAYERQQKLLARLFGEREQSDLAGPRRRQPERNGEFESEQQLAQPRAPERREPGQQPAACERPEHAQHAEHAAHERDR